MCAVLSIITTDDILSYLEGQLDSQARQDVEDVLKTDERAQVFYQSALKSKSYLRNCVTGAKLKGNKSKEPKG